MRWCDVSFAIREMVIGHVDSGRVKLGIAVPPPRRDHELPDESTDGQTGEARGSGSQ